MSFPTRVTGTDGKSYPAAWLTRDDRAYVIGRVHYLAHDEALSVRQIARRIADEQGVRRSVGSISSYLSRWRCERCSGAGNETPEQLAGGAR